MAEGLHWLMGWNCTSSSTRVVFVPSKDSFQNASGWPKAHLSSALAVDMSNDETCGGNGMRAAMGNIKSAALNNRRTAALRSSSNALATSILLHGSNSSSDTGQQQ